MIKAYAEGNTVTINIHSNVRGRSLFDGDADDCVHNVEDLKTVLKENKNAAIIDVYINSPGGDVVEGIGIYNILKRQKAYKRVFVDGFACSIASVIAMAGNSIQMPKSSMQMIHMPWTVAMGNAQELRKMADDLDKMGETIINAYMSKFSGTRENLVELLENETYLSADECLNYGLCTKVVDDSEETESNVDNGIVDTTSAFSAKLEQLQRIKNAIKDIESETENVETTNEGETPEAVNEAEPVIEDKVEAVANTNPVDVNELKSEVEAVKQNALMSFFNYTGK